jgi:LuxR family transcriptional regulator, maltose regulon positive regulatory protein
MQHGVSLLEDKLRIPRPGMAVLRRSRVTELIEAAVTRRVALITGPAGAGKTVATAIWARSGAASRRTAWLTLDPADREPGQFWRYVVAALARAGAITTAAADTIGAADTVAAGDTIAAADLPPDMVRWISVTTGTTAEPVALVLDDLHVLAGSATLASLDDLIKHAPTGLRILLVGRHAAGLALARLRVAGELADVGAADLACTAEEMASYLATLDAPLSPAERGEIARRTGGWLAGLRLAVLGAGTSEADAQLMIADYIEDEVLGRPGAQTRNFLLRTSLTDTLPADLAHDLTGNPAAERLLDQLSRENGLVQAISPDAGLYRYHPMLREVLVAALRRELPDELPGLQRRVARWHASQGEVLPALQAAAGTCDWDFATEVLSAAGPAVMLSADGPELERVLAGFPPDRLAGDVVLAVAMAASRLWQGDADGALPHLESAGCALGGLPDGDGSPAVLWMAALRTMYQAAVDDAGPGWLDQMWSLASSAHEDPGGGPGHRALGMLWLAIGFAALRDLDGQQARSALLHAGSQLSAGGVQFLRERARGWESVACGLYGDLAAATRLSASVAEGPYGHDGELAPVLAVAGALVSLARDEPASAGAQLDEADLRPAAPRPTGEPPIAVLSGILRTRLAIADGNLAGARGLVRWLTDAAAGPASMTPHGVGKAIAVLDAEISLAAGERDRARAALPGSGAATGSAATTICQARLLIAGEDDKAALHLINPVLADPVGTCSIADRISALLTAAVAHRRLGQASDAGELLEEALALAEPDDACGPFIAAGPAVRSALTVLISPASRCAAFTGRILDRFDSRTPRRVAPLSSTALTESELAVLRFLPSHMTNQEIAESLFLSINTIKTHLSSVYRKLGVVNRRQAIAQGRRLELLLRRLPLAPTSRWLRPAVAPGGAIPSQRLLLPSAVTTYY